MDELNWEDAPECILKIRAARGNMEKILAICKDLEPAPRRGKQAEIDKARKDNKNYSGDNNKKPVTKKPITKKRARRNAVDSESNDEQSELEQQINDEELEEHEEHEEPVKRGREMTAEEIRWEAMSLEERHKELCGEVCECFRVKKCPVNYRIREGQSLFEIRESCFFVEPMVEDEDEEENVACSTLEGLFGDEHNMHLQEIAKQQEKQQEEMMLQVLQATPAPQEFKKPENCERVEPEILQTTLPLPMTYALKSSTPVQHNPLEYSPMSPSKLFSSHFAFVDEMSV